MGQVVVIGAGVGGLTTAAVLARAGLSVTVLEAHVYPGGCAGTFFHKNFQFDAGATLAGGFYPGGPMALVARATGIDNWPAHPANPAMAVHLPGGPTVTRWTDERRRAERQAAFGSDANDFWRWQERTSDALWSLAVRVPPWPPQSPTELLKLTRAGLGWLGENLPAHLHPSLLADAFRPVAAHLHRANTSLRRFVDAQLLIAAQTTSDRANALYGAAALDLPRRGVVHLPGGMGSVAERLAQAVRQHGGQIHYKQEVSRIVTHHNRPVAVETRRGKLFPAELVIANLPPWNLAPLLGDSAPAKLRHLPPQPRDGWGAFMTYLGVDASLIPPDFPLHHQIIVQEPLAEGNSVFLSLSPAWDLERAPAGQRALTLSTHTRLSDWWHLFNTDPTAYEARKQAYADKMIAAAEIALPGLREAISLTLPGTPVTFQRFTRRQWGWVGGFPQTSLLRAWAPRLLPNLWLVGDSIFPGQSTAAVALGGLRVASAVLQAHNIDLPAVTPQAGWQSRPAAPTDL